MHRQLTDSPHKGLIIKKVGYCHGDLIITFEDGLQCIIARKYVTSTYLWILFFSYSVDMWKLSTISHLLEQIQKGFNNTVIKVLIRNWVCFAIFYLNSQLQAKHVITGALWICSLQIFMHVDCRTCSKFFGDMTLVCFTFTANDTSSKT